MSVTSLMKLIGAPTSFRLDHVVAGRRPLITAQLDPFSTAFITVYAPNRGAERRLFLATLSNKPQGCGSIDCLFLAGGFNCTEDGVLSWNHASVLAAGSEADGLLLRSAGQVEKDTHTQAVRLVPRSETTGCL